MTNRPFNQADDSHYIWNAYMGPGPGATGTGIGRLTTEIRNPQKTCLTAEHRYYSRQGIDGSTQMWPNFFQLNTGLRLGFPHAKMMNVNFIDGHVKSFRQGEVVPSYFYPTWTP